MKNPVYKYPYFVKEVTLKNDNEKRYWLNMKIDNDKDESIIIILKNPSRATKEISDKTVFNVSNYIFRNREKYPKLKGIGNIIILNLIPRYETYSEQLKFSEGKIIDQENLDILKEFCKRHKKVIIAWGNHPNGLFREYQNLKSFTMNILTENGNEIFYIDKMSKIGNPKHGQIWGYENELIEYKK